jgi:phosphoenolpyruvate-protein kinase (PTS system EI component)
MKQIKGSSYSPGRAYGHIAFGIQHLQDLAGKVLVLKSYHPDELLRLTKLRPAGLILAGLARFSHLAIFLRSLEIPAILVSTDDLHFFDENVTVFIDGDEGLVVTDLTEEEPPLGAIYLPRLQRPPFQPSEKGEHGALTRDGINIKLTASVSSADGASEARKLGAGAIGLLRSEFLLTEGEDPFNVESNYNSIYDVVKQAHPLDVVVRLFDVGGEKLFNWVPCIDGIGQSLGIRGARLYRHPGFAEIFHAQVEALSRLSLDFPVSILIPYLTSIEEFTAIREVITQIAAGRAIKVGAMLETPAACAAISQFAGSADFLAVGTNDLMQCFFGADRALDATTQYLDPYSPALWRFLSTISDACKSACAEVFVCGELTHYPGALPLLIGLGFRGFSVAPQTIPAFRASIRELVIPEVAHLASSFLNAQSSAALKASIETMLANSGDA